MSANQDFTRLLKEIDETPWGPHERELTARAVALAVELGDEQLEYQARMRQSASANQSGDTQLLLSSFAWCLAKHDANPQRFPADIDNGMADLMWQFKWMASSLRASPIFASEQIAAVLDDMEAHYRAEGLGMSGVVMARFEDAWESGRMEEAETLRLQLEATPRDSHSHCDACGRSQLVGYFADVDRDSDAIRLVEEMIEGGFSCGEEPEHALARSLQPYLRAGDFDSAKRNHMRNYRLAKSNPDNLSMVAINLVFVTITSNPARALDMVERHIGWLGHDLLNVAGHVRALRAFGLALDAVTAAGHGQTLVRGADAPSLERYFGDHDGTWNAQDLAVACWAAAKRIGDEFDQRNGTTAYADAYERDRALTTVRYDLPLSSETFIAQPVAQTPQTADERYRRAIDLADWNDGSALAALQASVADSDPTREGDLQGNLIAALIGAGRFDEATALLAPLSAVRRREGRSGEADIIDEFGLALFGAPAVDHEEALRGALDRTPDTLARLSILHALSHAQLQKGDNPAALETARAAVDAATQSGDPAEQASALSSVAFIASLLGPDAGGREAAEAGLALDPESNGVRANLLESLARACGSAEDYVVGATAADEASRLISRMGATRGSARVAILAGALHEDNGANAEAAIRYRVAIRRLERDGEPTSTARFRLARVPLAMGGASEAAELLAQVFADEDEAGVPAQSRAQTAELLAQAFEEDDQPGNSVAVWSRAAELFEEAGNTMGQAHALMNEGRILGIYGEHEAGVDALEQAVSLAKQNPENIGLIARCVHLLGQLYGGMGDERTWSALAEVEHMARENGADWLLADVLDSRAQSHGRFGQTDQAVATALQAADAFAAADDEFSAAGCEVFAARTLAQAERGGEAVGIYQSVLQRPVAGSQVFQVAALELGDLYEAAGRHADAAHVRALLVQE